MSVNIATLHGTLPFAAIQAQRYTLSPIHQNFPRFYLCRSAIYAYLCAMIAKHLES